MEECACKIPLLDGRPVCGNVDCFNTHQAPYREIEAQRVAQVEAERAKLMAAITTESESEVETEVGIDSTE